MQLTTHTDYALRLLIYLAVQQDKKGTIQQVAKRFEISANHLAKVTQTLVHLNYVKSHRGRDGGLSLATEASSIGIGDVIRKTENLNLLPCFNAEGVCALQSACVLKSALSRAQHAFLAVLDEFTLADLVQNKEHLRGLLAM